MSAGLDSSNAVELVFAVAQQSFNPTAMSRLEGCPVTRYPEQLHLHHALEELRWTGAIDEFNDAARLRNSSITEPILITTNGMILAGFGLSRTALPRSLLKSQFLRLERRKTILVPERLRATPITSCLLVIQPLPRGVDTIKSGGIDISIW